MTSLPNEPLGQESTFKSLSDADLEETKAIERWFNDRNWSLSGKKAELRIDGNKEHPAARVVFPRSTDDVSNLLSTLPSSTHVAVVCGGHSSSNAATWAGPDAVIVDMRHLSSVEVDRESMEVTVGGGTTFRSVAEMVAEAGGALPIGTGDTVGLCGYALNGGISGYFGRRLGQLGKRVVRLTIVLADGTVRTLTPSSTGDDGDLFRACLGAGSAMGIVTSVTIQMDQSSIFKTGGQVVAVCGDKQKAKAYSTWALEFMVDSVFPLNSVSMEIVITADYTIICTFVFYDTFDHDADPAEFVQPLRDAGKMTESQIVADNVTQWTTWFEAASSLWPVIAGMKGDPMVRYDHCMGLQELPTPSAGVDNGSIVKSSPNLSFLLDHWMMDCPFEVAPMSIVEIRTLGGAAATPLNNIPSGNAKCQLFADMIVAYDACDKTIEERHAIAKKVDAIVALARQQNGTNVDFSATHSQSDDDIGPFGEELFGSKENYAFVSSVKKKADPSNRFRFHPFAHLLIGSENS